MRNHILLMLSLAALGATALPAGAAPYWIAYEGNDFPENEGWRRNINAAGGAYRWIEDGALVIDSRHNAGIIDDYVYEGISDPEADESFVAEWRVLVEDTLYWYDAGVTIARTATVGHAIFHLGVDDMLVRREWEHITIDPGEWHEYRIETVDMHEYTLSINGQCVFSGLFEDQSLLRSYFAWGDRANGAASLTRWDYVRFGVVPEPCSISLFLVLYGCGVRGRGSSALRADVEDWGRHQGLKSLAACATVKSDRRLSRTASTLNSLVNLRRVVSRLMDAFYRVYTPFSACPRIVGNSKMPAPVSIRPPVMGVTFVQVAFHGLIDVSIRTPVMGVTTLIFVPSTGRMFQSAPP